MVRVVRGSVVQAVLLGSIEACKGYDGMIPELRSIVGDREGITAGTVVVEDLIDSYLEDSGGGLRLAHERVLKGMSEDLGRYSLTGEGVFLRRGLGGVRELEKKLEHQLMLVRMLKRRCLRVQEESDRKWVSGVDPRDA